MRKITNLLFLQTHLKIKNFMNILKQLTRPIKLIYVNIYLLRKNSTYVVTK